eukprot:TRINITY_DN8682_c0_g1_i1.p1 TRINITY_DN8682_c0_g1~~TRINITY_DN8682_c0_g1_i1.p1  ORF type:complete len:1869 (+),score=348.11 TRINITY_DN8682_c0_g1_i1:162-5768(+)
MASVASGQSPSAAFAGLVDRVVRDAGASVEDVETALAEGAPANAAHGTGTPLLRAVQASHEGLIKVLLAAKAAPDTADAKGVRPLHIAVFDGKPSVVKLLLDGRAAVDARDRHQQTPLFFAPSEDICRLLLANRADLNAQNIKGQSALHLAAHAGLNAPLTWLARHADPGTINLQDKHGRTPAYLAERMGCESTLNTLEKHGADLTIRPLKSSRSIPSSRVRGVRSQSTTDPKRRQRRVEEEAGDSHRPSSRQKADAKRPDHSPALHADPVLPPGPDLRLAALRPPSSKDKPLRPSPVPPLPPGPHVRFACSKTGEDLTPTSKHTASAAKVPQLRLQDAKTGADVTSVFCPSAVAGAEPQAESTKEAKQASDEVLQFVVKGASKDQGDEAPMESWRDAEEAKAKPPPMLPDKVATAAADELPVVPEDVPKSAKQAAEPEVSVEADIREAPTTDAAIPCQAAPVYGSYRSMPSVGSWLAMPMPKRASAAAKEPKPRRLLAPAELSLRTPLQTPMPSPMSTATLRNGKKRVLPLTPQFFELRVALSQLLRDATREGSLGRSMSQHSLGAGAGEASGATVRPSPASQAGGVVARLQLPQTPAGFDCVEERQGAPRVPFCRTPSVGTWLAGTPKPMYPADAVQTAAAAPVVSAPVEADADMDAIRSKIEAAFLNSMVGDNLEAALAELGLDEDSDEEEEEEKETEKAMPAERPPPPQGVRLMAARPAALLPFRQYYNGHFRSCPEDAWQLLQGTFQQATRSASSTAPPPPASHSPGAAPASAGRLTPAVVPFGEYYAAHLASCPGEAWTHMYRSFDSSQRRPAAAERHVLAPTSCSRPAQLLPFADYHSQHFRGLPEAVWLRLSHPCIRRHGEGARKERPVERAVSSRAALQPWTEYYAQNIGSMPQDGWLHIYARFRQPERASAGASAEAAPAVAAAEKSEELVVAAEQPAVAGSTSRPPAHFVRRHFGAFAACPPAAWQGLSVSFVRRGSAVTAAPSTATTPQQRVVQQARPLVPFADYYLASFKGCPKAYWDGAYGAFPARLAAGRCQEASRGAVEAVAAGSRPASVVPFTSYYAANFKECPAALWRAAHAAFAVAAVPTPVAVTTPEPTVDRKQTPLVPFADYYDAVFRSCPEDYLRRVCVPFKTRSLEDKAREMPSSSTLASSSPAVIVPFSAYYSAHFHSCPAEYWQHAHAGFVTVSDRVTRIEQRPTCRPESVVPFAAYSANFHCCPPEYWQQVHSAFRPKQPQAHGAALGAPTCSSSRPQPIVPLAVYISNFQSCPPAYWENLHAAFSVKVSKGPSTAPAQSTRTCRPQSILPFVAYSANFHCCPPEYWQPVHSAFRSERPEIHGAALRAPTCSSRPQPIVPLAEYISNFRSSPPAYWENVHAAFSVKVSKGSSATPTESTRSCRPQSIVAFAAYSANFNCCPPEYWQQVHSAFRPKKPEVHDAALGAPTCSSSRPQPIVPVAAYISNFQSCPPAYWQSLHAAFSVRVSVGPSATVTESTRSCRPQAIVPFAMYYSDSFRLVPSEAWQHLHAAFRGGTSLDDQAHAAKAAPVSSAGPPGLVPFSAYYAEHFRCCPASYWENMSAAFPGREVRSKAPPQLSDKEAATTPSRPRPAPLLPFAEYYAQHMRSCLPQSLYSRFQPEKAAVAPVSGNRAASLLPFRSYYQAHMSVVAQEALFEAVYLWFDRTGVSPPAEEASEAMQKGGEEADPENLVANAQPPVDVDIVEADTAEDNVANDGDQLPIPLIDEKEFSNSIVPPVLDLPPSAPLSPSAAQTLLNMSEEASATAAQAAATCALARQAEAAVREAATQIADMSSRMRSMQETYQSNLSSTQKENAELRRRLEMIEQLLAASGGGLPPPQPEP